MFYFYFWENFILEIYLGGGVPKGGGRGVLGRFFFGWLAWFYEVGRRVRRRIYVEDLFILSY